MDNNLPKHESASGQAVSNPEADAFFNTLVERFRSAEGDPAAHLNSATATDAKTSALSAPEDQTPLVPFCSPGPALADDVTCGQCGSTVPAGHHICYICGTPRAEYDALGYRVATAAPGLKASQKPYDPYEHMGPELNSRGSESTLLAGGSVAEVYSSFPRHAFSFAPEEEVSPEPKPYQKLRPVLLTGLTLAGLIVLGLVGWNVRYRAGNLLVELRHGFAQELASLTRNNDNGPKLSSAAAGGPATRPSHARVYDARLPARQHDEQQVALEPQRAVLHVRVEGQPEGATVSRGEDYVSPGLEVVHAASSPMSVSISPRESLALLVHQVPPIYPREALDRHVQGSVVLRALIGKDGAVHQLHVMSGNELLVPAAIQAVRQWQYKPYYKDGEPQEVETTVVVDFSLAQMAAANNRLVN